MNKLEQMLLNAINAGDLITVKNCVETLFPAMQEKYKDDVNNQNYPRFDRVDESGKGFVQHALELNHNEIARYLLEQFLISAIKKDDFAAVKKLVENDFDNMQVKLDFNDPNFPRLDRPDESGWTFVKYAFEGNHFAIQDYLQSKVSGTQNDTSGTQVINSSGATNSSTLHEDEGVQYFQESFDVWPGEGGSQRRITTNLNALSVQQPAEHDQKLVARETMRDQQVAFLQQIVGQLQQLKKDLELKHARIFDSEMVGWLIVLFGPVLILGVMLTVILPDLISPWQSSSYNFLNYELPVYGSLGIGSLGTLGVVGMMISNHLISKKSFSLIKGNNKFQEMLNFLQAHAQNRHVNQLGQLISKTSSEINSLDSVGKVISSLSDLIKFLEKEVGRIQLEYNQNGVVIYDLEQLNNSLPEIDLERGDMPALSVAVPSLRLNDSVDDDNDRVVQAANEKTPLIATKVDTSNSAAKNRNSVDSRSVSTKTVDSANQAVSLSGSGFSYNSFLVAKPVTSSTAVATTSSGTSASVSVADAQSLPAEVNKPVTTSAAATTSKSTGTSVVYRDSPVAQQIKKSREELIAGLPAVAVDDPLTDAALAGLPPVAGDSLQEDQEQEPLLERGYG